MRRNSDAPRRAVLIGADAGMMADMEDSAIGGAAMDGTAATARRMWTLFEPVHVVTYFAPPARQAFEQAGLRGFWRGYFAGRAAPIGAVDAPLVIAAFCSFAPQFVRRALPAVWDLVTPAEALAAREAGAVASIRELLGYPDGQTAPEALRNAADLLAIAIEDIDTAGRPLGGPNAALPLPAEPVARLWHAATVLREHRGDGHIAALVAAGIDGCESLVLRQAVKDVGRAAAGGAVAAPAPAWTGSMVSREQMQAARGWTDEEWNEAADRLRGRGWLRAADGTATDAGLAVHRSVEDATDLAAARPWARLGRGRTSELERLLAPVALACAEALPYPNPVGVPRPAPPSAATQSPAIQSAAKPAPA
jgi:hypothetical protein